MADTQTAPPHPPGMLHKVLDQLVSRVTLLESMVVALLGDLNHQQRLRLLVALNEVSEGYKSVLATEWPELGADSSEGIDVLVRTYSKLLAPKAD